MHVLSWPKLRRLTDTVGRTWEAAIEPGGLTLTALDGEPATATFVLTDELRAFAMQVYAAALDHDLDRQIPTGQGRAHLKRQRAAAARRPPAPPTVEVSA